MQLSRRALISVFPAATLLAVAQPLRAWAAPQPAGVAPDHALLIGNTVAVFAGTTGSNARSEVGAKLASIESTARARLTAMDNAGPNELFRAISAAT